MERVIKFRAWYNNRMLYSHNNTINKSNVQNAWFFNKVNEDDIIMQFTGLTDKNGKEIYEGDVLEFTRPYGNWQIPERHGYITDKCEVVYEQDTCSFRLKYKGSQQKLRKHINYKYEIIGNVHEHPHLIK